MTKSCHMIDPVKLDKEIKSQGLKIWWLAEQMSVDRKTITRWLHGKVKWIQEDNLLALATILNCSQDALLRTNSIPLYSTTADQNLAAQSIAGRGLIRLLAPSGHFDLAESLIKGLLYPDLPRRTLAHLYIDLAHCCWQQNKLDEALGYAQHVVDQYDEIQDHALHLKARQHLITIHAKKGDLQQARELAEECLHDPTLQQDPEAHARILFDLSDVIGHSGDDVNKVMLLRQESRRLLAGLDSRCPLHDALDELGQAYFLASQDRLEEADRACRQGMHTAFSINFHGGMTLAKLLEADIASRYGLHQQAVDSFAKYYPSLAPGAAGLHEAIGAAIHRRAGYYAEALLYADRGLTSHHPVFRAHCHGEAARIHSLLGHFHFARRSQLTAQSLYQQAGAKAQSLCIMNDSSILIEPIAERA